MARRTWSFWREHGQDDEYGGFHGTLDRQGNPSFPEEKGLIQEARHLWAISTWYERRDRSPEVSVMASRLLDFLVAGYLDPSDGGFFYGLNRAGDVVLDSRKQLFAESYAIYALSTHARALRSELSLELALARFENIDEARHDATFGGYDQRGDPGFLPPSSAKGANTHLHLLEAFAALYQASGDTRVGERLGELVDLTSSVLLQPTGYVHAEFDLEWAPLGAAEVSYGHDLETAWLLVDSAKLLGRGQDPVVLEAAARLATHAAQRGFDVESGGYFERGVPGGDPTGLGKTWWVQFEALLGLWQLYELTGDEGWLDRFERTLGWVEATEDRPAGEWFSAYALDGSPEGSTNKGDEWKASYHSIRALVYVGDWIDDYLAAR